MKKLILFCLQLFAVFPQAFPQTKKIELLKANIHRAGNNTQRLTNILALCDEYQSLNRDTLDALVLEAKQLAAAQKDQQLSSLAALALANDYMQWGWADSALATIEPELTINPVTDPSARDIYFRLIRLKGFCYGSKSNYAKALDVFYPALSAAEKYKDSNNVAGIMNTIGSISMARNEPAAAINWILKAAGILPTATDSRQVQAAIYTNAGNAYDLTGKTDSALYYIQKAIILSREVENLNYLATALRVYTSVLTKKGELAKAEASLREMLQIRNMLGNGGIVVDDKLQLADFYAGTGQLSKAIALCKEQLGTGNIYDSTASGEGKVYTNDLKLRLIYYQALARYYRQAKMFPEYQQTLEDIITAKDAVYEANSPQAIADAEAKYEVQKKENTILQQKYSIQQKNFVIYGSLGLLLFSLIMACLVFRNYRSRQHLKMKLALAEEKRISANSVKEAEEKERVRIAADLHDNLGAYAASLASNLGYLQPVVTEDIAGNAYRELKNNSNAIISELNDTIWVLKKEALSLTAISDRIKVFISRISNSYPHINIDVQEKISNDILLPSSQAFHLYRIMQEAINNALKHSNGKNINVSINSDKHWKVSIADDGNGIQEELKANGNGIQHMRQRSEENGWDIAWLGHNGGGTVVEVSPTTN